MVMTHNGAMHGGESYSHSVSIMDRHDDILSKIRGVTIINEVEPDLAFFFSWANPEFDIEFKNESCDHVNRMTTLCLTLLCLVLFVIWTNFLCLFTCCVPLFFFVGCLWIDFWEKDDVRRWGRGSNWSLARRSPCWHSCFYHLLQRFGPVSNLHSFSWLFCWVFWVMILHCSELYIYSSCLISMFCCCSSSSIHQYFFFFLILLFMTNSCSIGTSDYVN